MSSNCFVENKNDCKTNFKIKVKHELSLMNLSCLNMDQVFDSLQYEQWNHVSLLFTFKIYDRLWKQCELLFHLYD